MDPQLPFQVRLLEGQIALQNGQGCDGGDASRLPTTSRERSTASTFCGSPTSKRNKRAEKCGCSVTSKIKNLTSAIVNFFALKRGVHGRWEHLFKIEDFLFFIFEGVERRGRYFKNQKSYFSNRQFFCPEAAVPLLQQSTILPQQSSIFFFLRSWTWKT